MGSDDDTYSADSALAVQEPESASAAMTTSSDDNDGTDVGEASCPSSSRHQEQVQNLKAKCGVMDDNLIKKTKAPVRESERASVAKTTPSDCSGGADGSGASSPSSRRHQEPVQNLKDNFESMGVPMRPEDNFVDEMKVPIKEPDITSVASMSSGRANLTPSNTAGGGNGSGAPRPWSLTQEEHVRNFKENCRRAFGGDYSQEEWARMEDSPWFAEVVAKLRVDPFLDNSEVGIEGATFYLEDARPLQLAVLMGDLEMVQKILETRLEPNEVHIDSLINPGWWDPLAIYSALELAIIGGESEIVDALLEKNAEVYIGIRGSLQLAVVHARARQTMKTFKIIQSLVHKGIDIDAKDIGGYSAFYIAVAKGKTNIVKELLKWKDKIHLNEGYSGGRPPIQIAHEEGFKDIESALMQCEDVRRYIESAFRDRQAYVDAANAILVGAALIASVTFASWLQPPLNYTMPYDGSFEKYVDVEHNIALGLFWVFNTLSFYFAIGTVVFGAHSVLPRRQLFITENVKKLSQNLLLTSILLAFSVCFVVVAFGIAGFIVLIPILRYRWYMIAPMILGGIVCLGSIGYLFKSLWENRPWSIRTRKRNAKEDNFINSWYNYTDD